MKIENIKKAVEEATRFLERTKALYEGMKAKGEYMWANPKQSGAVRRASMDLTRALAEMRKP